MFEMTPKSYLRGESGPRAVNADNSRQKGQGTTRHCQDNVAPEKSRVKGTNSYRSARKSISHRRKVSDHPRQSTIFEPPSFELDVIGQPSNGIQLGMLVETSVMISLRLSPSDRSFGRANVDTSSLLAVASLVSETINGENVPLEAGCLTGQKLFDSIHPIPEDCNDALARNQPCRIVLGCFSFPDLFIRQAGNFRLRVTLIEMGNAAAAGATSLLAVDSEPIEVERRGSGSFRRHQRVYG